jgi:predicted 3-demethylubiquinone-9 3-methyltransferase (glyoxalase superfamily)
MRRRDLDDPIRGAEARHDRLPRFGWLTGRFGISWQLNRPKCTFVSSISRGQYSQ